MKTQNSKEVEYPKADTRPSEGKAKNQKPSTFRSITGRAGWLTGGPLDWFGRKSVGSGAGMVSRLWSQTRQGSQRDSRFKVCEGGEFDFTATACSYGITVEALEKRLEQRQRMTMLVSYGALAIALFSVMFWIHSAIAEPYTFRRVLTAVEFLPFIGLCTLLAFYNALLNFQIRSRRSASWRAFLSTEEGFFPR
jgi:hypothetical protein